ncbi:MAG: 23S rRNA (adenine(2503)-C(2))-methyltransferase RlmN [Eubacteriales bacterium]|nr:23S rRNA (adenine(2503)-C(2))-methyltransferase RlmN [Christensenellaceae bacterium]MDD7092046.1 23S rRNA (adenine(2503)-C(2))-methyltransferase RlmN [Christensenellaceae bacterium]MDY3241652.1 23S rRNA (adenine(2503)-C(2))-methyltransferase RlmN [Eubacteriales bacterium]MDY4709169.1 23S rRNA (adenine(2503)-C(2))-methyltransferase RlmN [Eubacteriales bacterium]MDY6077912.1 23S rRNA (adenine(2503)-C(2))-methyltransferase RlmN [Eubacteriales bacterium]
MKTALSGFDTEGLKKVLADCGQPPYRAKQLREWVNRAVSFDKMSNLPKPLIATLSEKYSVTGVEIIKKLISRDGTVKYLFALGDGNVVEGVLMRYKYGNTLCISTQVGCRMGCAFCASGIDGLIRNLTAGEILGEVLEVNRDEGGTPEKRAVTNVVLMGSGEPLDNYDNVTSFLRLLNDKEGLNISERNVSLSTCGITDNIKRLADDGFSVTLTISLHAADDETRKRIMPTANKYKIADIVSAAKYYFEKTGRRYIFEYSLIKGVNDGKDNMLALAKLLKGLPCHVNLIRLNYVKEKGLKGSDNAEEMKKILENEGISATVRRTMGSDIDGACGQLRRRFLND